MVYIGRRYAPTSGTALNAWITLSRAIIGVFYCNFEGLKYFYLWAIGDVIGCLLATWFYNRVMEPCIVHMRVKRMVQHELEKNLIELEHISGEKINGH